MRIKKLTGILLAVITALSMVILPAEAAEKLPAPENIKAYAKTDSITLKWDEVPGADAYRVYLYNATDKKFQKVKTVTGTQATVTGLLSETIYTFRLAAVKKSGKSYTAGTYTRSYRYKTKSTNGGLLVEYFDPNMEKGNDTGLLFEYNDNGKMVNSKYVYFGTHSSDYEFNGQEYSVTSEYEIEYKKNKIKITKVPEKTDSGNIGNDDSEYPVAEPEPIVYSTVLEYDKNYNLTKITDYRNTEVRYTKEYKYDKNGNVTSYKRYYDSKLVNSIDYNYDGKGRLISENYGGAWETDLNVEYAYDKSGNLITKTETTTADNGEKKVGKTTYTYDKNGNKIKSVDQYGDATVYSYDSKGNLIKMTVSLENNDMYSFSSEETVYEYYSNGALKHYIYSTTDKSGKTNIWSKPYYVYKAAGKEIDTETEKLNEMLISYFSSDYSLSL